MVRNGQCAMGQVHASLEWIYEIHRVSQIKQVVDESYTPLSLLSLLFQKGQ
jgi:hypothetical protein